MALLNGLVLKQYQAEVSRGFSGKSLQLVWFAFVLWQTGVGKIPLLGKLWPISPCEGDAARARQPVRAIWPFRTRPTSEIEDALLSWPLSHSILGRPLTGGFTWGTSHVVNILAYRVFRLSVYEVYRDGDGEGRGRCDGPAQSPER